MIIGARSVETTIDTQFLSILLAAISSALVLIYKVYRVLKSDRTSDAVDAEETAFRQTLRDDAKQAREETERLRVMLYTIQNEKLKLAETCARQVAEIEHLKAKNGG